MSIEKEQQFIEPEKEPSKTAEEILKEAMKKIEDEKEMQRLEDEAYREKEQRERAELEINREKARAEEALKFSLTEGAKDYMLIKVTEIINKIAAGQELKREEIVKIREEAVNYLKEKFGYTESVNTFEIDRKGAWLGGKSHINFGYFTAKIPAGEFTPESYFDTIKNTKRIVEVKSEQRKENPDKNYEKFYPIWEEAEKGVVKKHLEGFGRAALDHNDLDIAVEAFILADLIKNPEYAQKIAQKMDEMIKSEKPEIRAKALSAKEKLERYFKGERE